MPGIYLQSRKKSTGTLEFPPSNCALFLLILACVPQKSSPVSAGLHCFRVLLWPQQGNRTKGPSSVIRRAGWDRADPPEFQPRFEAKAAAGASFGRANAILPIILIPEGALRGKDISHKYDKVKG